MKKNFFLFSVFVSAFVILASCGSKNNSNVKLSRPNSILDSNGVAIDKDSLPVISFEEDFHDFGRIKSGEKITYAFKFKNTGNSVLIISNVSTSCGCTISSYPKQPIQPGDESSVNVSFDSSGRSGLQNKSITVYTNTQPSFTLLRIQSLIVESGDI
jgi:hypothetical protein